MSDYEEFVKRMGSFDMALSLDDVGPNKDELKHHGILGMKWGVLRYQNKDGTRTKEGKERQQTDAKTISEKAKSLIESQGSRTVASCKAGASEEAIAYAVTK